MSPPNLQTLALLLLLLIISLSSSPLTTSSTLSTIAISHITNRTLICALAQSTEPLSPLNKFDLKCTSFPNGTTHLYPSRINPYSAVAAGDGFLCALTSPLSSNTSTMRWWDFAHNPHKTAIPDAKRVYRGPALAELSAGDSHVCALTQNSRRVECWRWPQLDIPKGRNLTGIAVGADFVCGLARGGVVLCFGGDDSGVVGGEPEGKFTAVAAGTSHACGITREGGLACWGARAPEVDKNVPPVVSMALGENRTCVLDVNSIVHCWGPNLKLPADLESAMFISIQARGDAVCGVLLANYSLVCWGSERFEGNHVVFKLVLPGPCASRCPCEPFAGSATLCTGGAAVCRPCPPRPRSAGPGPGVTPIANQTDGSGSRRRLIFIVLGSVGFFIGLIVAAAFLFLKFRLQNGRIHDSGRLRRPAAPGVRPAPERSGMESHLSQLPGDVHSPGVEAFPLNLLLSITARFSEEHKIGSGSFGSVYRATLEDGRTVAIKRAESFSSASTSRARSPYIGQNRRQDRESAFCSEIALLSRVNHKNLVRLLGYCNEGSERIIVYEFMTNGTLNDLLHKSTQLADDSPLSSWAARIRVALDAARGIEYLHTYAVPRIIHRDIKSSNILLDEQWTAKVSDFGLSLLTDNVADPQLRAAGTVGYMDPEYYRLLHLTAKSDVYSFGVVLLEILSGCKVVQVYEESGTPKNVVDFAVPHILGDEIQRVLDPRLAAPMGSEMEAVAYVGELAADCVRPEGRGRPTMTKVVSGLERALITISGWSFVSQSAASESCGRGSVEVESLKGGQGES